MTALPCNCLTPTVWHPVAMIGIPLSFQHRVAKVALVFLALLVKMGQQEILEIQSVHVI